MGQGPLETWVAPLRRLELGRVHETPAIGRDAHGVNGVEELVEDDVLEEKPGRPPRVELGMNAYRV